VHSFSVISGNIAISYILYKTRFLGHICRRQFGCIFNHIGVIGPQSYRIWWNNTK